MNPHEQIDCNHFFDLQVNGCYGVDFNSDTLDEADLHQACTRMAAAGVEGILATVITDQVELMASRLKRIAQLRASNEMIRQVIAGVHIEGPFINETRGFVGAHPTGAVRPADLDVMLRLLDAAQGLTRVVTLAPERDADLAVVKRLSSEGVIVSAGHCNPTLSELESAIDAGLSMFTHLGNGCPSQLDRHDNIINRMLHCANHVWCCFIADGVHLPFYVLANYLKLVGVERSIIVTDGIAAAGLGPGEYSLGGQKVSVDAQGRTSILGNGQYLAGSVITMQESAQNLLQLGISKEDIWKMTYQNPRKAAKVPTAC